jgi:SPP1 family predicted phage head-tail adaptor
MRINAGKYRHVVTFQKNTGETNSYGEISDKESNWTDYFTTKAGIFPINGKEALTEEYSNSQITHRIHIRYIPNMPIDSHMRIKFGGRIFTLTSPPINFQEMNREYQILCKEVTETI